MIIMKDERKIGRLLDIEEDLLKIKPLYRIQ